MFTVFGVAYSFGAFLVPMAREFGTGSAATSELFSITAFLYFTLGLVSGPAVDRFGPRPVLLLGALVMGAGLFLTSLVHQIWLAYATYGLGVGIATACGYVPMVAVIAAWFERRRSLASGLAVSGIGVGTLVGAPAAGLAIAAFGWRGAYVALAPVAAGLLLVAAFLARRPPRSLGDGGFEARALLADAAFRRLYLTFFLTSVSLFVVLVYLVPSAGRADVPAVVAPLLIGLVGAASTAGRVVLGFVADRFGAVRSFQAAIGLMAVACVFWLLAPNAALLFLFAAVYGLAYGGYIASGPGVTAALLGTEHLGGKVGFSYSAAGVAALAGPPLVGLTIDATRGYTMAIGLALAVGVVATAASLGLARG
jgi:MFS family permease